MRPGPNPNVRKQSLTHVQNMSQMRLKSPSRECLRLFALDLVKAVFQAHGAKVSKLPLCSVFVQRGILRHLKLDLTNSTPRTWAGRNIAWQATLRRALVSAISSASL